MRSYSKSTATALIPTLWIAFNLIAVVNFAYAQNEIIPVEAAQKPFSVSLSHGRSPQAGKSGDLNPRTLYAFKVEGDSEFSFAATVAGDDELEMIQWNKTRKNYDFKAFAGYQNSNPSALHLDAARVTSTLKPLSTASCIRCHQNEGPIFSRQPWLEIDDSSRNHVARFDEVVRKGNRAVQSHRYCASACSPSDSVCRKKLLLEAIKDNFFTRKRENSRTRSDALRDREGLEWARAVLVANDFSYISSVMPDRKMMANGQSQTELQVLKSQSKEKAHLLNKIGIKIPQEFNSLEELEATSGRITYLDRNTLESDTPKEFNTKSIFYSGVRPNEPSSPLYVRPRQGHLTPENIGEALPDIVNDCFSFSSGASELLSEMSWESLQLKLSASSCNSELWAERFTEKTLSAILDSQCNSDTATEAAATAESTAKTSNLSSVAQMQNEIKLEKTLPSLNLVEKQKAEQLFSVNCFRCHGSGKALDLKLASDNIASFSAYRNSMGMTAYSRISKNEMPPDASLKLEEITLMLRYLKSFNP